MTKPTTARAIWLDSFINMAILEQKKTYSKIKQDPMYACFITN